MLDPTKTPADLSKPYNWIATLYRETASRVPSLDASFYLIFHHGRLALTKYLTFLELLQCVCSPALFVGILSSD